MQQKKLILTLNKIFTTFKVNLFILFLSIFSVIFTFYYGYIGILPIDSFLIYDAGYKVLNGFYPFKDYWSITGPILDFIQFFFFKMLGVSWFSYVLHSAIINLFLTIISFNFFISFGLKKFNSFIYSLSISILAYPSVGTPFMDHHAVIFSFISLLFLILGLKTNKNVYWFFTPIFLLFSFLSKQIPSAYLLIIFIIFIFMNKVILHPKNNKYFISLTLGSLLSIFLFLLIFIINDISLTNFITQYLLYPLEIGNKRGENIFFDIKTVFLQFKFIYFSLIPLFFIFIKLAKNNKNIDKKKDLIIIILIILSILLFIFSQIMTKNQILIFLLIPFCLGISNYYVVKYYNKKFLLNALILVLVFVTIKFHLRFNENKKFMELNGIDLSIAVDAGQLDKSLKGLKWISTEYPRNPIKELKLLEFAKEKISLDTSNKIIMSDYQILPSIISLKTASPNKWFDILSVPSQKNKYFLNYKEFFLKRLIVQKIDTIYVIGEKEIFLENILKENCYIKENIKKNFKKFLIKNCFN